MSVRVVRTRNGEDVICDIREISQEGETKVLGYQLIQPYSFGSLKECLLRMIMVTSIKLSNPEITMEPYAPLAKDKKLLFVMMKSSVHMKHMMM